MSWLQTLSELRPPKPTLTEEHVPDLSERVYLITGGSSGIGLELARILYWKNARVYIAGRSQASFDQAVENINKTPALGSSGTSKGALAFFHMDLSDLTTIKPAVDELLKKEVTLWSVWYNAGVMVPPKGSKTQQGYELQWGTNVIAHFLLHSLLTPILTESARRLPPNTVRTMWVSSIVNVSAPPTGINWDDINDTKGNLSQRVLYSQSKAGAIILAHEAAQRQGPQGIVSVSLSPGSLKTGLQRHLTSLATMAINLLLFEPRYGALTELFAGFSDQLTSTKNNGVLIIPWGRIGLPRKDIQDGLEGHFKEATTQTEPGRVPTGTRLWELLEKEIEPYTK